MYARASLLAVITALLAGACTQPAQTSGHIVLPLDSYKMNAEQEATYFTALDILTQRCMRQRGHEWPVPPRMDQPHDPNSRRYGVVSDDDASRFGYHPMPDPIGNAQERTATKRNAVEQTALEGSATQPGCLDIASQQLDRGSPDADYGTLTTLDWDSLRVSEQHPQVAESQRTWSGCMRERGYAYPRPQDAVEDPNGTSTVRPRLRKRSLWPGRTCAANSKWS